MRVIQEILCLTVAIHLVHCLGKDKGVELCYKDGENHRINCCDKVLYYSLVNFANIAADIMIQLSESSETVRQTIKNLLLICSCLFTIEAVSK